VDFLTKKKKINEGEIPQYYVENNHPAIIAPDVFDMVQQEISRREKGRGRHSGVHLFSGRIKYGQCGNWYGSKVWHSTDKYRRTIWQCNHKFDNNEKCSTPHLTGEQIQALFLSALRKLLSDKDEILATFEDARDVAFNLSGLIAEKENLQNELLVDSELMHQCINENAHIPLDQAEYQKRYDDLTDRFDKAKTRLEAVTGETYDKRREKQKSTPFLTNSSDWAV
jgi:site-specific DNA recombinase